MLSLVSLAAVLVTLCNAQTLHKSCTGLDLPGLIGQFPMTVESSPNPIATLYPQDVTGTINGTIVVVPIPYDEARSIIPSQYGILTKQIQATLPGFPNGFYPLIIRLSIDHDIIYEGISGLVPDFSSVRFYYPFVDLLGDTYSAFAYAPVILATATNPVTLAGAAAYGENVYPASFIPRENAYAFTKKGVTSGEIFFNAYTNGSDCPVVTSQFELQPTIGPWPFNFYVNVTNQPVFADPKNNCDQQITLYNSSITTGKNAAVGVKGDVFVAAPYFPTDRFFRGVYGLKVDIAFIENNMLPCSSLKGL